MKMRVLAGTAALALIAAPGLVLAQAAGGDSSQTSATAPADLPDSPMPDTTSGSPSPDTASDEGTIEEAPAGGLPETAQPSPDESKAYPACSKTVTDHCRNPKGH